MISLYLRLVALRKHFSFETSFGPVRFAIVVAMEAHGWQRDKAGQPYIFHPLAVMGAVKTFDQKIVAVLHDTLEDTDLRAEDLRRLGFEPHIVAAVEAMTHHEDEPYEAYILRLNQNALARVVKRADIAHNMSPERLAHLPQVDVDRLTKKYKRALELLAQD
jgi:(p)ppGpp synthase/HD superfamily hydrolase